MNVLFSHPTGNQNVRHAVTSMHAAGLIDLFVTSVATFPGNTWDRLSRTPIGAEFARRAFDDRLKDKTVQRPWHELGRLACGRLGLDCLTKHEKRWFSVDAVYHSHDRFVSRRVKACRFKSPNLFAVYCYEDGARLTFREAKKQGKQCFYDLPIGYWRSARSLLKVEHERWPQWASTMPGFRDSDDKLARKDEELRLADQIYVASQFTRSTLDDYPGTLADVHVIPYGFPDVAPDRDPATVQSRKLKLLFVGGLSQRKGIADVFSVADALSDEVELTVVGNGRVRESPVLASALKKHTWIRSLPHAEVLRVMREHDVLVFPSLFEGFGLVITEAMSQGTPVITTDRTAGPDVITHDEEGWIVPAGDTQALKQQIERLLAFPDKIAQAGYRARETAMRRPWTAYGSELADHVRDAIAGGTKNEGS